jgi:hypothetical protein
MGAKSKETVVVRKSAEKKIEFNDEVNFSSEPSKNIKDSWNQITLSLATNGGFTVNKGKNYILSVFIKEKINGKDVISVKSFEVTKQELSDLEYESREFMDEVEKMLVARDIEETAANVVKSTPKDIKKSDKKSSRAFTEILKKSLDSVRKKDPKLDEFDPIVEGDVDASDEDLPDISK